MQNGTRNSNLIQNIIKINGKKRSSIGIVK